MLLFDFFRRHPLPEPPAAPHRETGAEPASRPLREDALARAVGKKAAALFSHRKLLCAEAILVAVNESFGAPLTEDQAVGLGAGLTAGLGDRGCLCGGVAGACLAVGAVCARGDHAGSRAAVRREAAAIHEAFVRKHKSACCRVLTKPVKDDGKAHAAQCALLTGYGAELAARSILRLRPELLDCPEAATAREGRLCGRLKWLLSFWCR
ncbi:MAG: C-GCAxxG-C-C family (seleno)protein [Solidesulfovibrio sp.]|uniref:C-GCAxxG-C-C family protein n=1 Tax=Solidesulfovibrio sp. TaxID=2910990 RepID=UPI002B211834|nr:C-GCAxxG-C-C family (seleno)protein [Solidesulfovibrio sp.]MEA4855461.1 C-GCAxxG-C-C family (seleno)protein [Solidesulfovibrio sp.]